MDRTYATHQSPADAAATRGDRGKARRGPPRRDRLLAVLLGRWPRRVAAAGCLVAAALSWAADRGRVLAPPAAGASPASSVPVLVAARDLPAGVVLGAADVRSVPMPRATVPAGVLRPAAAVGRRVGAPMRRGEPVVDVRLLGPGLTAGLTDPATVAVPVRVADRATAELAHAGDRVDLLAVPAEPVAGGVSAGGPEPGGAAAGGPSSGGAVTDDQAGAAVLAEDVRILAVLGTPGASVEDGAVLVVAADLTTARRLAVAMARQRVSVALRPP
jgi:Flp pilus assembly protein CpaB